MESTRQPVHFLFIANSSILFFLLYVLFSVGLLRHYSVLFFLKLMYREPSENWQGNREHSFSQAPARYWLELVSSR